MNRYDFLLIGVPVACIAYYYIRRKMSGGDGGSDSGWRDITVIDVAIVLAVGAFFLR
jgi:hypothetical protein